MEHEHPDGISIQPMINPGEPPYRKATVTGANEYRAPCLNSTSIYVGLKRFNNFVGP
jgi:hypothetical protein